MTASESKLKVAVIGKDGRTSAITQRLESSPRVEPPVFVLSSGRGRVGIDQALDAARRHRPDFVVVGPEEPLALGIVDRLASELGIPSIGPTASLARLESSKAFTRELLSHYGIPGNPEYRVFTTVDGIDAYVSALGEFVIKPDGLTGGKGVKVSGEHLGSVREAVDYCREIFEHGHPSVVIEEKLEGEEFSLQSFCDGTHVKHMIPVQDHKRVGEGDTGPNTGGMGSYTSADHTLPFLDDESLLAAQAINDRIPDALFQRTGARYKGILFGGFMATKKGVRLLEYNARFGDPEALNVLSVLETDLCEVFDAIIHGSLDQIAVTFKHQATVCRYIVPTGYPTSPVSNAKLESIPQATDSLRVYFASVDERPDGVWMTGSRAVAVVGIGRDLEEANRTAENAAASIKGPVFYRKDIGTRALVERRIAHMAQLRGRRSVPQPTVDVR